MLLLKYGLYQEEKRHCRSKAIWWQKKKFNGERLWARGYAASTVDFEEAQVRAYIKQLDSCEGVVNVDCSYS